MRAIPKSWSLIIIEQVHSLGGVHTIEFSSTIRRVVSYRASVTVITPDD